MSPLGMSTNIASIYQYKSGYLFSVDLAQRLLHNTQALAITDCSGLEEIIRREEEGTNPSNYINHPTILLPNLKMLKFVDLRKLRSIYSGRIVCPSLEFIEIYSCDKIERLPFCKENTQNPTIELEGLILSRWWHSFQWDDPNARSIYLPILTPDDDDPSVFWDDISKMWGSPLRIDPDAVIDPNVVSMYPPIFDST